AGWRVSLRADGVRRLRGLRDGVDELARACYVARVALEWLCPRARAARTVTRRRVAARRGAHDDDRGTDRGASRTLSPRGGRDLRADPGEGGAAGRVYR